MHIQICKYDDFTGRFFQIDPLWEKYYSWTPYHYSANNPVSYLDPGGTVVDFFWESRSMKGSGDLDLVVNFIPINIGFGITVPYTNITADVTLYRYEPSTNTTTHNISLTGLESNSGIVFEYSSTIDVEFFAESQEIIETKKSTSKAGFSFFGIAEIGGATETTEKTSIIGLESATITSKKSIPLVGKVGWSLNLPGCYLSIEVANKKAPKRLVDFYENILPVKDNTKIEQGK
jgi:hypothetical protein